MSYLSFNEEVFFKPNKNRFKSFFHNSNTVKKKPEQIKENPKPKIIKTSISKHIQNQLPNTQNHNPNPDTPLKRNVLK